MIVKHPNTILLNETKRVTEFGKGLSILIKELKAAMKEHNGIGIAANQIGVDQQVAVIAPNLVLINPEIVKYYPDSMVASEEGCLSIDGEMHLVHRYYRIQVRYQDRYGHLHFKNFKGIKAIVVQHEIDHLNGYTIKERSVQEIKQAP